MTNPAGKQDERRIAQRIRPAQSTVCRFDPADAKGKPTVGFVWDISVSGVSMLTGAPPKPGEILSGELAPESGGDEMAVLVRVVHVRLYATGDFMVGAQFLRELTPVELKKFSDPS